MIVIAKMCIDAIKRGNKILVCGNGGSAAQAQHFAAELVVRYKKNRRALPCIALTADTAILTACANDLGYDQVFARQVEAYGKPGDVLLALSTSGRSVNVHNAIQQARKMNIHVVLSECGSPTDTMQEKHLTFLHQLAEEIENAFT